MSTKKTTHKSTPKQNLDGTTSNELLTTDNKVNEVSDQAAEVESPFVSLLIGNALKLSDKSSGQLGYELSLNTEDNCRYLRLTSNDSGGLFSKEWVKLDDVFTLLESMQVDEPFKSSVFKAVVKGGSANNVSFFSAVLRSQEIALIIKSEKSQFLHLVNPILSKRIEHLSKLKPLTETSEN
ncbi:MAG: hypothetical protein ACJAS1_002676 [Oleiphilaceae bacterium]|jgi:hypothetical protein